MLDGDIGMTGDGGTGQWRDTPLQLTKWRPNEQPTDRPTYKSTEQPNN